MRREWWLWAVLAVSPAALGNDLAEMNAVSKLWDRYAEASSQNKPESVDALSTSSLAHFGFLRDAALYASTEQVRRLPSLDRMTVYLLRASQNEDALRKLDDRSVARLCIESGWSGVRTPNGVPLVSLSQVTIVGDYAVGESLPPTETYFQFGPDFDREADGWKFRYESLIPDSSESIDRSFKQSSASETQMFEMVLARLLKTEQVPRLASLDRPLIDDSAARVRLTERWPRYEVGFERRVHAIERKAEDGDTLAQTGIGLFKITGEKPHLIAKDEKGGLALLEKASEGGNTNAAEYAAQYLLSRPDLLDDAALARLVNHARRAAEAGSAEAMDMLGNFYFEGVGGIKRDCRMAADWHARAEEAGVASARNNLVWVLATCPLPDQRDPARALSLARHMMEQGELPAGETDTLAAVMAANGDFAKAIEYQQRAISEVEATAKDDHTAALRGTLKRMKTRLAGYRRGRDYVQDYTTIVEIRAGRY